MSEHLQPILSADIYPSMFGEISRELWDSMTQEEQRVLLESYEGQFNV